MNERYEYTARSFRKAIYQEDTGQLYGDEARVAICQTLDNQWIIKLNVEIEI